MTTEMTPPPVVRPPTTPWPNATPALPTLPLRSGPPAPALVPYLDERRSTGPVAPAPGFSGAALGSVASSHSRRAERYGAPVAPVARGVAAVIALSGSLATVCWMIWVVFDRRRLLTDIRADVPIVDEAIVAADDRVLTAAVVMLITAAIAATAVMVWMLRAYRNVGAWRPIEHGVGWAVVAWFVPFLNLWRPATIMSEIVEGSPASGRRSGIVWWWWLAWLTPLVASNGLRALDPTTPDDFVLRETLLLFEFGLVAVAAMLLMAIIARATADQRRHIAAGT